MPNGPIEDISFEEVRRLWEAAGGKNTRGILEWFRPPTTTGWRRGNIPAREVGEFRFIGGMPGDRWAQLTGGTYRVKDGAQRVDFHPGFRWDPSWHIVAVIDPETGARTIIDGNERALQLLAAVENGEIREETEVGIVVGELNIQIVRIAKAVSSLWR